MLASRWAPSTEDMRGKGQADPEQEKENVFPPTPGKPTTQSAASPQARVAPPAHTEVPKDSPRKRKKVLWNGRQCVIYLPSGAPEKYGGARPISLQRVSDIIQGWQSAGYDTNGFDVQHSSNPEIEADRGQLRYIGTQDLFAAPIGSRPTVRIADPKAWHNYTNWLVEEKLRALGVAGPDEDTPLSRQSSNQQQQSRNFSPSFGASMTGSHAVLPSQRSTSGLSTFSTGTHSRAMSIASPLPSGPEPRGHVQRHSVYGASQAFQQVPGLSPNMRPFSPSQQLSLNPAARAISPGLDRLKSSASPVPRALSPLDGQPFRPSPVMERRFSPSSQARPQPLAPTFSPRQVSAPITPSQTLAGVPEDDGDIQQQVTPRAPQQSSDIVIPTPRGHRHNISENFERGIHDAERTLEQQSTSEQPKLQQQQFFGDFNMSAPDSFPFRPPMPVPNQGQFMFGVPGNMPTFQPQAFAFQPQMPFVQPSFDPNQTVFQPHASSFNFAPSMVPQAQSFEPGMFNARPNATRQSSTNLDVSAPAFKPQGLSAPSLPSRAFDFSSDFEFKPGALSFEPPKAAEPATGHAPIFDQVKIPNDAPRSRKPKAVAIVRAAASDASDQAAALEEDESGRLIQSTDRQKRAFQTAKDDGDAIPLFAERPASPARPSLARSVSAQSSTNSLLPIQGFAEEAIEPETNALEDSAMDLDEAPKALDEDEPLDLDERSSALGYTTDDNKENAPIQGVLDRRATHTRNISSLSALAKPFDFVPRAPPAQEMPLQVPAYDSYSQTQTTQQTLDPQKPEFVPARIFSRDVETIEGGLSTPFEPERRVSSPVHETVTQPPIQLSAQPSFEEIDAVMRQMNEEEDEESLHENSEAAEIVREGPHAYPASTPKAEMQADVVSSPGSVRIHSVSEARSSSISSLSSISSEVELDLPSASEIISPAMVAHSNRNIGPSSQWSADLSLAAEDRTEQRSGVSDDRVDEDISNTLQEQAQPLKEQMDTLRRSLSAGRSTKSDSRARHVAPSGPDSDADDEDDIADSKFLPRPVSSRGARKYEMMKAAVSEALNHRSASPERKSRENMLERLDTVNNHLDALLLRHLNVNDVRDAVEEALLRSAASLVQIPQQDSSDSEMESYRQENFDNKKLLRLAEEELAILRDSLASKDNRLNQLESERRELRKLRDRADDEKDLAAKYQRKISDLEAESSTLHATLEEYRALRLKLKHDQEDAEAENKHFRTTIDELEAQLADSKSLRDNMRDKLEKIQTDMARAAEQLANQKVSWQRQNENLQKRNAVLETRLDSETQLRAGLESEINRLRMLASEGESARAQVEQNAATNAMLEETIQSLRDDVNELQTANSRVHRELQDARENSRLEVQRAQLMMQAGVEKANSQADATRLGLESKLSVTHNELENLQALMEAMKSRHEVLLQEEADLRRDTLLKVNEASSSALENLRARHEEDIQFINAQHERALSNVRQDASRSEHFWNERLTMSEEREAHQKERIAHLEERLSIAKAAASAAAAAAQNASRSSGATPREPERISPQALRESILVLQEQLQEREARIEQLTTSLKGSRQPASSAPPPAAAAKLKEKDIEIAWLRELLAVRADDLTELITTLDGADGEQFDRAAARDAATRIRTQMQIEMQEKERHIRAGDSLPAQALAGLTNFASPRAVQLAAAFGNWRARGAPSGPTPRSVRRKQGGSVAQKEMGTAGAATTAAPGAAGLGLAAAAAPPIVAAADDDTPSKSVRHPPRPGSAASWMSGLMTPPATGLRRTPSPSSFGPGQGQSQSQGKRPVNGSEGAWGGDPATPGPTPVSLRRASYDEDAGIVGFEMDDDDDVVGYMPRGGGGSLAQELEPLG